MMTWSWRLERAYWAREWPLLWRRGWWLLPTLLVLAMMSAIPFVGQLINWLLVGMIAVVVLRRILAARHFDTLLHRRWQFDVANSVVASWPALARNLRLGVKDLSGVALVAGAGRPEWDGYTCVLPLSMPPGLMREDLFPGMKPAQAPQAARFISLRSLNDQGVGRGGGTGGCVSSRCARSTTGLGKLNGRRRISQRSASETARHQPRAKPPRCRSYAGVSGVIVTITLVAPTGVDPVTSRFSVVRSTN